MPKPTLNKKPKSNFWKKSNPFTIFFPIWNKLLGQVSIPQIGWIDPFDSFPVPYSTLFLIDFDFVSSRTWTWFQLGYLEIEPKLPIPITPSEYPSNIGLKQLHFLHVLAKVHFRSLFHSYIYHMYFHFQKIVPCLIWNEKILPNE